MLKNIRCRKIEQIQKENDSVESAKIEKGYER